MQKEMNLAAKAKNYEQAAQLRNRIFALRKLDNQIIFGDRESIDLSKDRGLIELSELLKIKPPRRIEGFDISHMQGTDTVASMVVFVAGVPDKSQYRKFKSRIKGNDDFIHMRETMSRRFSEKNIKLWGKPDLILIDGGKGQVSSALSTLQHIGIYIPLIGLAKRYEEIIIPRASDALESVEASPVGENKFAKDLQINSDVTTPEIDNDKIKQFAKKLQFETVHLPSSSDALKLLQRIRDESHRFAISYHSTLKRGRQTVSALDSVPSIGAIYKKKLIKEFGSVAGVRSATQDELALVVGPWRARLVKQFIG